MTSIARPPLTVEIREEATNPGKSWLNVWETVPWADFARDNPDIANDVASDLCIHGHSLQGGGAVPAVTIRPGLS